ncbi:SPFH domain-containing protein [Alienimonas californiensis]|uniref:SPFH domain / Band 7 family protein n=1 Tax=Alienimonas californiensis TaxID=2527989 RepID=A0A517P626_9PLAN|nr:SPFH domain-containing protein [Alienimonas californiensis]QDT14840.1 SPFH domain / Band 7 family protein [Alienimonas californiensis]
MGLFDRLRGELVDIIEWVDDDRHTLVWRFPRYRNEIKNGAQLIVRPGQTAVFVSNGRIADVFEPGHYTLDTDNLPLLSTLQGWKHGFESPFKSEVYFVSTRTIGELKWGTPNPIMLRDDDFGPVRLRAFGTYTLRAQDPQILLKELVGTDSALETGEITELMRGVVVSAFADLLGESKIAALDLAANYRELGDDLAKMVNERIDDEYGLEVPQLYIINVSLPESVEKALDARSSMGVIGDLGRYQQFQLGNALGQPGGPGGGLGEGVGLGLGFQMANQLAQGNSQLAPAAQQNAPAPPPPPPLPGAVMWHVASGGQSRGPIPQSQLEQAVRAGQVGPDALVWTAGMPVWESVSRTPIFASQLGSAPPPLPGG